jgi:hypothetical protein
LNADFFAVDKSPIGDLSSRNHRHGGRGMNVDLWIQLALLLLRLVAAGTAE